MYMTTNDAMGNITHTLNQVNFKSKSYHVLLYGLNNIGPKIEEIMYEEGNSNRAGPWLFNQPSMGDPQNDLPSVMLRECVGIPSEEINLSSQIYHAQNIALISRFSDSNTIKKHYELTVLNLGSHNPRWVLEIINSVVYMLRIRGFKFITPMISSRPFTNICHGEHAEIVELEDTGIGNYDTSNISISLEDCKWVEDNIFWFHEVIYSGNEFLLPLNMLYASYSGNSNHAKLASIWVGMEALIKTDDQDISKTMKMSLQLFGGTSKKRAKDLWSDSLGRCKVIHGVLSEAKTPLQVEERIDEVRSIFCTMLRYFIEKKIIPNKENIYEILGKEISEETSPKCVECESPLICLKCSKL